MKDIQEPAILLTTKDLRTSSTYYIINKGPGAPLFADWPLAGAVASSVAAPLFFAPVQGNLVDGGVGSFGNPCLATSVEAVEYLGMQAENLIHISLGNGYQANTQGEGEGKGFWLKSWIEYLISEGLDDAAMQQVFMTRAIYRSMDFRRYNPALTRENIEHNLELSLGEIDPIGLSLDSSSMEEVELMEQIGYALRVENRLDERAGAALEYHRRACRAGIRTHGLGQLALRRAEVLAESVGSGADPRLRATHRVAPTMYTFSD